MVYVNYTDLSKTYTSILPIMKDIADSEAGEMPANELDYSFDSYDSSDDDDTDYADQLADSQVQKNLERMQNFTQFDGENYNYLAALRTPLSADDLIQHIKNSRFLMSTQRGLIGIVNVYLSTDTLLANIENVGLAVAQFRISVTTLTATAPRCDTTTRQYMRICDLMEMAVRIVFTRTHGAYRERRLQDMNRSEVVTGKLSQIQKEQPVGRRNLLSLPVKRK